MTSESAEQYGKHSRAHAGGPGVVDLLRRAVAHGDAIRLAWDDETRIVADQRDDFPTAVLPVVRDEYPGDDEDTEPSTAVREARKWFMPELFTRLLHPLAG